RALPPLPGRAPLRGDGPSVLVALRRLAGGGLPPDPAQGWHLPLPADGDAPRRQAAADVRGQPDRLPRRAGRRPGHRRPAGHPRPEADGPPPTDAAARRQPGRDGPPDEDAAVMGPPVSWRRPGGSGPGGPAPRVGRPPRSGHPGAAGRRSAPGWWRRWGG